MKSKSLLRLPSLGHEGGMRVKVSPWGTASPLVSGRAKQPWVSEGGSGPGLWAVEVLQKWAHHSQACQDQVLVSTSIGPEPSVKWYMKASLGGSCAGGKQRGHSSSHRPECGVSMVVTNRDRIFQWEKWGSSGEATWGVRAARHRFWTLPVSALGNPQKQSGRRGLTFSGDNVSRKYVSVWKVYIIPFYGLKIMRLKRYKCETLY